MELLVAEHTNWLFSQQYGSLIKDKQLFRYCYPAVRTGSSNIPFFSVVLFFSCSLAPDFLRPNRYVLQITFGQFKHYLQSFSVDSPKFFMKDGVEKLLERQWPKNLFDESKDKNASKL